MLSQILILACIVFKTHWCTLIHSKSFPYVVELNTDAYTNPIEKGLVNLFESDVTIGSRTFSCSAEDSDQSSDNDESVSERLHGLLGSCWDVPVDQERIKFYRICLGREIKEFELRQDGSPGITRLLATSKSTNQSQWFEWGLSEEFTSPSQDFLVRYKCNRSSGRPVLIQGKPILEVDIPTALVCSSLNAHERHVVITTLPRLTMMSEDLWWEYQYEYPTRLLQIHVDPTGKTPLEIYSLGNQTETAWFFRAERSLDPENPFIQSHLELKFINGTLCDKHNLFRETIVRFRCPLSTIDLNTPGWVEHQVGIFNIDRIFKARLASVKEPDVCTYVINVETTALCVDPEFIPREFEIEPSTLRCKSSR